MPADDLLVFLEWFRENDRATLDELERRTPYAGGRDLLVGYVDVFRALGLLDVSRENQIRLAPDATHASAFFRAMADLQRAGKFVLGRLTDETDTWLHVLQAIERRRLDIIQTQISEWKRQGADIAEQLEGRVRKQSASVLVLVGAWEDVRYLLLEFDTEHWKRYRLIGGKRERGEANDEPETPLVTMERELREELDTRFERALRVDPAGVTVSLFDVSRRLGELSYYTFHLFQPSNVTGHPLTYDGTRKRNLWWVRLDHALAAVARRDDLIFHELFEHTVVRQLLTQPRVLYELSRSDTARIIEATDVVLPPP